MASTVFPAGGGRQLVVGPSLVHGPSAAAYSHAYSHGLQPRLQLYTAELTSVSVLTGQAYCPDTCVWATFYNIMKPPQVPKAFHISLIYSINSSGTLPSWCVSNAFCSFAVNHAAVKQKEKHLSSTQGEIQNLSWTNDPLVPWAPSWAHWPWPWAHGPWTWPLGQGALALGPWPMSPGPWALGPMGPWAQGPVLGPWA